MAVSVVVCDIFNVKQWPDLETGLGFVQGHWISRVGFNVPPNTL